MSPSTSISRFVALLVQLLPLAPAVSASLDIVPGATWTAAGTNKHIQAHGTGLFETDGVYYIIGENHTAGASFQSINCYSSTNLLDWTFENELLTLQSSGDLGPSRIVERPKVIYNDNTKQYVMWMHIDDSSYAEARAGVATSASVCGDYTYLNASQPLGFQSRDLGLFKDTDGTGYLLTEDRENGLRIDRLSADYLTVESNVHLFTADYEAPAVYKTGDTYFMFASQLTGWSANDNKYTTATNLSGPWSDWADFAPAGSDTYDSQTSFVADINGLVMYMGDRWVSTDLAASTYIWLPLTISGTTASLTTSSPWTPSVADGTWTPVSATTTYGSKSNGTLSGSAVSLSCSGCSAEIVGYLGGPDNGTLTFSEVAFSSAGENTVQISYGNGDSTQRYCAVSVNGVTHVVAFLPSGGPQSLSTSVLNAVVNEGANNVISFGAFEGGYCPDIAGIVIS
ncbi:glycosyl hydrolase family 43 protein [Aspergillus saccharolyticus JOP 1030-1]|uniref:Glycosyl hydrolase family 43 protein n=1 Tax=Aspergillus saccharolyticus JOP 1030-1 TaxID=1450539 RepID=A0A318ZDK8_9EURO|nr:glycosyl hydrolase family 43 protein [Aspergillus saccharolyticus JOP 1030-1]PYH44667.1 glycosyl hydrolase family 43 protein [Aspergillus saccharolyticus JOP 1030-1]